MARQGIVPAEPCGYLIFYRFQYDLLFGNEPERFRTV
jgi:hypothetical protein